jgi:hypothetical protein
LQLLAFANKEGKEQARRFDWQKLQKEATFTTLATEIQTTLATVASDFGRILNETMWNRTANWRVGGPLNPEEWQRKKASAAQVGIGNWFRIRGGSILFYPTPTAGESIYFEYISNQWCESSTGTDQSAWADDDDVALIDEEIIRLGVIWRFKKSKGLDYSEDFRTYEMALIDLFGPDAGKAVIDMTGEVEGFGVNLPEGSWTLS